MPFDIALSGLNAASADLETISNNVANSATHGFKKSRAEFADVYATQSSNAIGRGVRLAAVTQQFGQGNLSITENPLDLAISGDGFFRLNDNGSTVYSRAGAFGVDRDGFIVNTQQQRLTGFIADAQGNLTGATGDLRVDTADLPPRVTTAIDVGANLDASQTVPANPFNANDPLSYNHSTSTTVYDSLGSSHIATMYYSKSASNQWQSYLFVDGNEVNQPGGDALAFANDGSLFQINGGAGTTTTSISFNPGTGAAPMTLTMDYADLTQYGSPFGVNALSQDGFTIGRLSDVGVDDSGMLSGRYSNGQTRVLGQVVLSNFANSQGLRRLGDTNWAETFSSGAALTGAPGSGDLGLVQSGALEEANVDLTEELVNMITAQRNFQANAQVISTADQITQTIINIR
ncbi:MAG: flagellar hook protein FlgE [Gammaproteobacteria bacterium]